MVFEIVSYNSDFRYQENTLKMCYSPEKTCRRVDITASQKHDLCLCKEQNVKAAQVDIVAYFGTERDDPYEFIIRPNVTEPKQRRRKLTIPSAENIFEVNLIFIKFLQHTVHSHPD